MKKKNKVIPTASPKTKKQLQAENNLLNESHRDLSKSILVEKDERTVIQKKLEFLNKLKESSENVTKFCKDNNYKRMTIYTWYREDEIFKAEMEAILEIRKLLNEKKEQEIIETLTETATETALDMLRNVNPERNYMSDISLVLGTLKLFNKNQVAQKIKSENKNENSNTHTMLNMDELDDHELDQKIKELENESDSE